MHGKFKEDLTLREIEMYADYDYFNLIALASKARKWDLQANVAALCLYTTGTTPSRVPRLAGSY